MMSAAAMGATAFQKALGAIHALSHPVGALYDTHHGLTNAVFMPYVLAFNRPAIEDKIARLAAYLGLAPTFDAFLAWVLELRAEIGIPHTLAGPEGRRREIRPDEPDGAEGPHRRRQPVPLDEAICRRLYERAGRQALSPAKGRGLGANSVATSP